VYRLVDVEPPNCSGRVAAVTHGRLASQAKGKGSGAVESAWSIVPEAPQSDSLGAGKLQIVPSREVEMI
jgi:hypothetical protein